MSKKKAPHQVRCFRHPKPAWVPFVHGLGSALDLSKETDYWSFNRADLGTAWSRVGSLLFHSAVDIGCVQRNSHHVFDLDVIRDEANRIAQVFEFTSRKGDNCYVAVHDGGDDGIDVVGITESESDDDSNEPGHQLTKQINWVEEAQSEP